MLFTTFIGPQASGCFETLSSRIVCENAGHGEECSNFDMLENNSWPHSEHTYIPENEERGTVFYIFTAVSCYTVTCSLTLSFTHQAGSDFYILHHQKKSSETFHPFQSKVIRAKAVYLYSCPA